MRGLRAAVGFLTTVPVQIAEGDYECFATRQHLFVLAGIGAGLLLGLAGLLFQWLLPAPLAAVLMITCLYLLTGTGHLDGLADTGDGIVAHGSREKKIAAMKDVHTGTGGILFLALDLLFLFALLSEFAGSWLPVLLPLLAAEVGAKLAMSTVIAYGRSTAPGMGSFMIERASREQHLLGAIAALAAVAMATLFTALWCRDLFNARLWLGSLLALLASLAAAAAVMLVADRHFGGVSGDVMGAANEIARIAALAAMGATLWMRF